MKVSVEKVSKKFGPEHVFRDVELDIGEGECVAVYGGNGSGKTTLLRIINLLEGASAGRLTYEAGGTGVLSVQAPSGRNTGLRRKMIMAPQAPFIFRGSVSHNVNIGSRIRNENKSAAGIMEWFGLWPLRDEDASSLSAGQKQKISLARSFLPESELLLLDEPGNHLDDTGKSRLSELIILMKRKGKSFVISTPDISELNGFPFDKICRFRGGRLHGYHPESERAGMGENEAFAGERGNTADVFHRQDISR